MHPIVFSSLGLAVAYIIYQRFFSPLAGIPGPFFASLSRLWLAELSWRGGTHEVMVALHKKHGKLVRIGPSEVSVAEPEAIKKIYGAGTKFRKSDWYSVWQGHRKFDLFPERNEKLHGQQRSLVSRPYSMAALTDLEPYMDNTIRHFMKRLDEVRASTIDLGYWLQLFAFDVIGEITFSKSFAFLDTYPSSSSPPPPFSQIEAALRSAAWIGQLPAFYWMHDFLMPYVGNHLAITARHGSLRDFAVAEVTARKDRGSDHQDVLGKLLDVNKEKPEQLPIADVMSMATTNIFAGSDTTAVSTRACVWYLLKHPECKARFLAEIDGMKKEGKLSDTVQLNEAEKMPYLQAVMYEALRMHPAVGMSLPRVVPEGGFEVDGKFMPAGTVIGTNPWVLHKDKSVFGDDADFFNPERWMKEDVGDMHRCFFTFGAGARMCLGRNIGWMEMSKVIPTLFARYHVELAQPEQEWTMRSWWFVMQRDIYVNLRPRS